MYITYLYNFHVSWSKKYIVIHCEPQKTVKYDDDIQVTHEDVFYSRGLWFSLYPCIPTRQTLFFFAKEHLLFMIT